MVLKLADLQAALPKEKPTATAQTALTLAGAPFDLDGFMARHFPGVAPVPYQDGRKWILQVCPWNAEHTNAAAFVIQRGSGVIQAGCHHNGCQANDWHTLRAIYQPKQDYTRPTLPAALQPTPPTAATELETNFEKIIRGEIVNEAWGYSPTLTKMARCLLPGTITCLCGTAGSTKSMFISMECLGWLEQGTPFAVFHLEEDRTFHQTRAIAQKANQSRLTDHQWITNNPDAVRSALATHKPTMDALGASIWDAPDSDVSLPDVVAWIKARASEGKRVIVVDPITAADSGREPWSADRRFILDAKRIMRESGASLVLVTHPRSDNKNAGSTLDNLAGGRAYNRFTQAVLWMEACDAQHEMVMHGSPLVPQQVTVNRKLHIRKARSGAGNGLSVGYFFDPLTLNFTEHGIICEDKNE